MENGARNKGKTLEEIEHYWHQHEQNRQAKLKSA